MPLLNIARLGNPVLRRPAVELTPEELASPETQRLIDDMIDTMRDSEGVGLAAPQVHAGKRIILVEVRAGPAARYPGEGTVPLTAVVNPRIVEHSPDTEEGWEGCLSIPDLRGQVPRWRSLRLRGLDRHGNPIEIEAAGFFARVIQHEVDHLDGIVFLDRMTDFSSLTHLKEFQKFWMAS